MGVRNMMAVAMLASIVGGSAWAQGSLLDIGKGVLKQQLQQGGTSSGTATTGTGTATTGTASSGLGSALSTGDIGSGLKEALRLGAERVTGLLGKTNGYNNDPDIHIPLPQSLKTAQSALKMAGLSGMADDLELKMNRAAEAAAPQARQIFTSALEKMTLDDARTILNGPQDAATQYFKRTMTPDLKTAMRPVIDSSVAEAGVVKSYESLAKGAPILSDGRAMLTDHVLDYALAGLFTYLGREEASIRSDPAKRSTELLRKVFGN